MNQQKKAAYYIIRSLARVLVEGMKISIDDIIQMLKTAITDIGINELNLNYSQISSRTGIPREKIKENLKELNKPTFQKPTPALRVMLYWISNPFYTDKNHQPKTLTKSEFKDLCKTLTSNIKAATIEKTLKEWGVLNEKENKLKITRTNAINKKIVDKTSSLTTSACGLLNTYYLNTHVAAERRIRENVVYSDKGISVSLIPKLNEELNLSMMEAYKHWNLIFEKYENLSETTYSTEKKSHPGAGFYQINHTVSTVHNLNDNAEKSPIKEIRNEI